jgi:hypothetical protein
MSKKKTHRKHNLLVALVGLVIIFLGLFSLPGDSQAQEAARFGYSVATTTVGLQALSPENDLYSYRWSFGESCSADQSDCYEKTGQEITVGNMRDFEDVDDGANATDIFLDVHGQSNTLVATTSATITLGSGVNYADSDGDGTINQKEDPGCKNDPDPDCGGGSDDDNIDDSSDEDAEPPSDGLVNCGRQTEVKTLDDGSTTTKLVNPCGYDDLINLVSIVIKWLIGILVLVATLLFTYAGFLYLGADGNSNRAEDAKRIFTNVAFGFVLVLVSVLFVTTLVTMFTKGEDAEYNWQEKWMDVIPLPELGADWEGGEQDDEFYA